MARKTNRTRSAPPVRSYKPSTVIHWRGGGIGQGGSAGPRTGGRANQSGPASGKATGDGRTTAKPAQAQPGKTADAGLRGGSEQTPRRIQGKAAMSAITRRTVGYANRREAARKAALNRRKG